MNPAERQSFVLAETRRLPVPHVPEIALHVADEAIPLWQKTEEELATLGLPPPFWAFAWAGGQALARYVLDQPGLVAGCRVLDFASGSGLCAIAAAKAGAAHVAASDLDPFALAAIAINSTANGVVIDTTAVDMIGHDEHWDVVLAGDIFYERDLADRVFAWLSALKARGATVLIGDPGRSYLPKAELCELACYQVPVTRVLEDADVKQTRVWRIVGGPS